MKAAAAIFLSCAIFLGRAHASGPAVADLSGAIQHPLDAGQKAGNVLIFYWHDCPICNAYAPEINRICGHYTNFNFFIVQVDPDLTVDAARRHAHDYDLRAPVLLDKRHTLVKLAKATVTPEAVVFGRDGRELYRGRIDNLYASLATRRPDPTEHDLRDVLDAIAAGKQPPEQRAPPIGCIIP